MQRLAIFLLIVVCVLAACDSGTATPQDAVPAPTEMVKLAAANVRAVSTLKMTIERSGAEYIFESDMGTVAFTRLEGQYVAPDSLQAKARVTLGKLPLDVDVYARGADQWIRGIFSNMEWQKTDFATGFNPQSLISQENSGFETAMASLRDVRLVGEESLEDGTPVYHLSAAAAGNDVSALVAGLLQMTGDVQVDVYIGKANMLPLKIVIVQPDSVTETEKDPTTWTIEIYDFNVAATLEAPDATAEVTPQS